MTVSRVLNNAESVREKNRQKVLQAMKELNYQPSAAARSLAFGKTGIVGLTISTLNDSFLDGVVKSVNRNLERKGYFLALSVTTEEEAGGVSSFLMQQDRVDGLILVSPRDEERFVLELKSRKLPFILIDNQLQNAGASNVIVDNYTGGLEATRHLLSLGHVRVAHISGPDFFLSSRERKRGFLDALKEAGVEPFAVENGGFSVADGFQAAQRWIGNGTLPTAVFAADDFIALGVVGALKDAGFRVPEDVSVVGYDDQVLAAGFYPRLTTVKQPEEEIGRQGVDLLLDMINEKTATNTTIKLKPALLVRDSTAVWRGK